MRWGSTSRAHELSYKASSATSAVLLHACSAVAGAIVVGIQDVSGSVVNEAGINVDAAPEFVAQGNKLTGIHWRNADHRR